MSTDDGQPVDDGAASTSSSPPSAPAQQDLADLVEWLAQQLQQIYTRLHREMRFPDRWPHMAALLQVTGTRMADAGAQLAAMLAAYAEAHPAIEVPEGGPSVFLLTTREHEQFWRETTDLRPREIEDRTRRYAEVFTVQYGRPDLGCQVVALDERDTGDVLVLQYVAELGPDAVVRVYLGGGVTADTDVIAETLDRHGITVAAIPAFLPPLWPDRTFISVSDCPDMFDVYGRRVVDLGPS